MSIITLSSDEQSPSNFQSFFPQGLNFGRYAEVSIMGYSGTTKVQDTNDPDAPAISEWVISDTNDTFAVYLGDIGSSLNNVYYQPFTITIPRGTYSNLGLTTAVQNAYKEACYLDQFSHMVFSAPNAQQQINIKIALGRPPNINALAHMKNYDSGDVEGVAQAANGTTLSPFDINVNPVHRHAYLDLEKNYMGDNTIALGVANGGRGFLCEFDTQDQNWRNYQMSFGLIPEEWITRAKRGQNRTDNLEWDWSMPLRPQDFAFKENADEQEIGHFVAGMSINLLGNICVITDNVNGRQDQRTIIDTGVNLGVPGPKKLCIQQKVDANDRPVIEFLYDIGAGWVLAVLPSGNGTIDCFPKGNGHDIYNHTQRLSAGVVFNPNYINANTNIAGFRYRTIHGTSSSGWADYAAPRTNLIWENWDLEYNGGNYININSNYATSGTTKISEKCDLKSTFGFYDFFTPETAGNMWSTGLTGAAVDLPATQDQLTQPLLITSPDLSVKGYVGAGAGGGAEAQILGVMRTATNIGLNQQRFAETTGDNWIALNNAYPFSINRLQIIIKDFTNKETNILQPTTRLWLKMRCKGIEKPMKPITIGSFSASY